MSKTGDQLILRPFSQDSPCSVSTGETPRQEMSKAVAPRDAEEFFGGPLLGKVQVGWTRKKRASEIAVTCELFLEGGSGAVVLVEYFAFVDAHDPVESEDKE